MNTITIQTEAKLASSIREMVDPITGKRRIGMVYYQKLSDGGLIARSLSDETDKEFLLNGIKNQIIYLPLTIITTEKS
jgi:hypothetical protein